jgi:hypothetical protein
MSSVFSVNDNVYVKSENGESSSEAIITKIEGENITVKFKNDNTEVVTSDKITKKQVEYPKKQVEDDDEFDVITPNNQTVPEADNQTVPEADNQNPSQKDGPSEEQMKEQSDETNVAAAAANSTVVDTTPAIANNAVYAIIQIDSEKKITVLDNADGQTLTSDKTPYDLLANKTPSIFAVKIVKKDNCVGATDQIKCIDFGNSHYELDLSETITDTKDKLLNSEFLSEGAVPEPEVAESEGAVPEGVYSKDYTPKFKAGDTINYNGKNSYIRKIGKSTTDGKPLYDIGTGINAAEDVDKTATLAILSHGGSRKNRGQQSKKTKRKYYVYRNNQV